ncbi:V/A-type H+-transporting ATPase subunit E [Aequitasia blattaphilus]|uniref:V-type ATP synthase subunit E family protein n=1 Tax=Aequitasia blattaphilus TaxID=2949332 RepID=A0ABT1E628_9FIRM|nr:V-type ATP synthase subunit E family protein [Aequitasia blattaphilus]MCP1101034.1 V-type ATP synthase subunit E family protein [Aequitasia blattaphilus]MCR8613674.1 V-type ATP synthase subunit E family protein [Aequitasia blattaphilus]
MTGLDKVQNQILAEAKEVAQGKLNEANQQAKEMIEEAQKEADKTLEQMNRKSDETVKKYEEKMESSIDMERRTRLLSEKQGIINEMTNRAYEKIKALDDVSYFAFLLEIFKGHVRDGEGVLYFSAKDLERIPSDFLSEIEKASKEKGGSVTVSKEAKNIENGFVLAYGDIEENCTIKALFDDKKDLLRDKIHQILFS